MYVYMQIVNILQIKFSGLRASGLTAYRLYDLRCKAWFVGEGSTGSVVSSLGLSRLGFRV